MVVRAYTEEQRIEALASLNIFDTEPEAEFDIVTRAARRLLGCKISLISLIDRDRQWFKSRCGLDQPETTREHSFCTRAVEHDELLIVEDARRDHRFVDNPLVAGPPHICFYAGVPIHLSNPLWNGTIAVGTLCVIDDKPHSLSDTELGELRELARLVEALLEARSAALAAARLAEERQRALDALDRSNRQLRQAERMANMGSWRLTLADRRTSWSDHTFAIHGLAPGEQPDLEGALAYFPPHSHALVSHSVETAIATGKPFDFEADFITAQDERRRVRSIGEVEMVDGVAVSLIGVLQDITQRHQMEQALRAAANTDALTQLASRGYFNQIADQMIETAREDGDPLAMLLIDLDHFKAVNDRCGHPTGDDVLRSMAEHLQDHRLGDVFACRLGGDEFALLVSCPAWLADLPRLIETLLRDLRCSVPTAGACVNVSATIGACLMGNGAASRSELMKRADEALYRAKRCRRGTAAIYGRKDLISIGHDRMREARLAS